MGPVDSLESVLQGTHTVVLSDDECLFIAGLLSNHVRAAVTVKEVTFAGRCWHKIVPSEWKESL